MQTFGLSKVQKRGCSCAPLGQRLQRRRKTRASGRAVGTVSQRYPRADLHGPYRNSLRRCDSRGGGGAGPPQRQVDRHRHRTPLARYRVRGHSEDRVTRWPYAGRLPRASSLEPAPDFAPSDDARGRDHDKREAEFSIYNTSRGLRGTKHLDKAAPQHTNAKSVKGEEEKINPEKTTFLRPGSRP